ncbi:hypothetical protein E4P82_06835 [Candidatus Competibacter phosphatis]|uniref:Peptidase S8/S53 domain-containing protein n=2 Tax=Candidatus Competibacter phosphatis TaxID=221280 RepID=A0ABX1TK59_9GAMM|nr:hypothetical protein [Candidatus Competibacter phosphatis]
MTAPLAATPPDGGEPPDAASWFEKAVKSAMAVEDEAATAEQRHQDLLEQAQEKGRIPVIVRLKMEMAPETTLDAAAVQAQHDALASVQQQVLDRLSATARQDEAALGIKRFTLTPAFGIQVDALALTELLDDPNVLDVIEDRAEPPSLAQSVPLIGADSNGTFSGRTGQGWVVAILDSGIDKNHPFLSGKVVSEACYSSNTSIATSVCPGGVTQSTATNSGLNCSTSIDGCKHGTHVAGIATGKGTSFSGVAKDADLIAVQVFSRFASAGDCYPGPAPCILSYTSDQIRGLERVYALRNSYQIASVNMSIGGGKYTSNCDSNSRKSTIDNLRAVGIATVISSGNEGYTDAISAPACISSAVSVGSTTKSDIVSSFSNSASFLDLLAPGSSINSSVPGGGYESWNGTSMAAPHVAGAWAVLKQAKPAAGVAEVLNALKSTGKAVTDARNGITKPRIQVNTALAALIGGGGGVGTPILISPSGMISDTTPTYTWTGSSAATWYRLYVQGPSGVVIDHWYTAAETNCSSDTSCVVTPTTTLASGNHRWWVQAWGSGVYSNWSSYKDFTVSGGGGGVSTPILISPSGTISDTTPTYLWTGSSGATWYRLYVQGPSGVVIDHWYTAAETNCSSDTSCAVTPTTTLASGNHRWWVQAWGSGIYSAWSSAMDFSVSGGTETNWGVWNPVYCTSGSALTFQGRVDGVTKYSVSRGAGSITWEGYQATSPGYKTLYFSIYGSCVSTWNGSWSPPTYFAAGQRYWFQTGLNTSGNLTITLYSAAGSQATTGGAEVELLDTYVVGSGGKGGLESYSGATSVVKEPGY